MNAWVLARTLREKPKLEIAKSKLVRFGHLGLISRGIAMSKTFIATCGNKYSTGSWYDCLNWAHQTISEFHGDDTIVKFHCIRAGEKSVVIVAEITCDGVRVIEKGRVISLHSFLKKYDVF